MLHEVEKVTFGYRWVLTYNLVKTESDTHVSAAVPSSEMDALRNTLSAWAQQRREESFPKSEFAYILDHEYSLQAAGPHALKGQDLVRGMALQELCEEKNEFTLLMATMQASVHHPDPDDYGPRAYDPAADEVTLKKIVDMDGVVVGEEIDIEKSSIIQDPFDENERVYEQHGRYTGNAGTDWRFLYRKTVSASNLNPTYQLLTIQALIIVPRTHITDFLVKQFHDSFRYFLSSPRKDRTDSFSIRHLIDYMIRRLQKNMQRCAVAPPSKG